MLFRGRNIVPEELRCPQLSFNFTIRHCGNGGKEVNDKLKAYDLRMALDNIKSWPGELIETDVEVDPVAQLAGVYRYVGAGGTVKRPTKAGPAMLFNNIKGHSNSKILIGLLSERNRVAKLLDCDVKELGKKLLHCVDEPIMPVMREAPPSCQQVVHYASEPGFDLNQIVPAPTNTPKDAGPYITMGMCYATHPDTGASDVTIHRLCIQGRDELSIFFTPGVRHIGAMAERAEQLGIELPISVSIGVDPAIEVASCFEPPTTPQGFNELSIAGALRGQPVELCSCLTVPEKAIANAEYVIEGIIIPNRRINEDMNTNSGYAMPEFPGYLGEASRACRVIKVKAVTHRLNPIMQTCIGPSGEHVNMAGICTEASIYGMVEKAIPGRLKNVYAHPSGGGKYMAILEFCKKVPSDEGRQRQAALLALSAFTELKHVVVVDEDVDIFDSDDVLWAMNTRFQANVDTIFIPGTRCHPLDPSSTPEYSGTISDRGIACKTIFDCTVPYHMKEKFKRAPFLELDPSIWVPGMAK